MAKTFTRPFHSIIILAILLSQFGIMPVVAADYTFTVNSTVDAVDANPSDGLCETITPGECTLRAAIQEANALGVGNTITIDLQSGATYILTEYDQSTIFLPLVKANITIHGNNAVIQPGPLSGGFLKGRIFLIDGSGSLTLNLLAIQNGSIDVFGEKGAGVLNLGQLTVTDSTFSGNGIGDSYGGGIANLGVASVTNSTFSNNGGTGRGGAIYNEGQITITNSIFTNNGAMGPSSQGGSIYNIGTLGLSGSTFVDNDSRVGGNIGNDANGTMTINNSTLSGGSSFGIGDSIVNSGDLNITNSTISSGLISTGHLIDNSGVLNITDSTVKGSKEGGIGNTGTLTVTGSTISNNTATNGGGIFNDSGTLTVNNSTFSNNSAGIFGGGIYNNGTQSNLTVTESTFSGNSAPNGGAIFNSLSSTANIINSSFSGNGAVGGAAGGPGNGGAIYNSGTLTLTNSPLAGNIGNYTGGGGIYNNTGILNVNDTAISNNRAEEGGGIYIESGIVTINNSTLSTNSGNNGGGVYNANGTLNVTNSTFFSNSSFFGGGGIFNIGTGAITTVTNSTFSNNDAINSGSGGIASGSTNTLEIINSIFDNNQGGNCDSSSITDGGGNLSSDNTCPFSGSSVNNTDPLLGPLQNNGGNTLTHALLGGSPAIDAGLAVDCPATDQRGVARPQGAGCDIGAFEADSNLFVVTNTNDSGAGSLRQAFLDANATANINGNVDLIHFDIPGTGVQTLQPLSALPAITDPVVIDGATQPGANCTAWSPTLLVEINGINAGAGASGLTLTSGGSGSTVRALIINRFGANGLPYENGITLNGSNNNTIQCNFIGTSADGMTDLGNGDGGIAVFNGSSNNLIGGIVAGNQPNLISGNGGHGVDIAFGSQINNVVVGNFIGTNAALEANLGNGGNGVVMNAGTTKTQVRENTIAANGDIGVSVADVGIDNTISNNSIFDNAGLGIDINTDGVTNNDLGDADAGPNNLQNYPVLATVAIAPNGDLVITYSVDSLTTNSAYPLTIEFFKADSAVSGEGQTFLSSTTLNAPGSRFFNLGNAATLGVSVGNPIVATATDTDGNTSEFSAASLASVATILTVTTTADTFAVDGACSLREAITAANTNATVNECIHDASVGIDMIAFNIPSAGVQTIQPTSALPNITDPVIIDGYTQPGATPNTLAVGDNAALLIELDGSSAGVNTNSLQIATSNSFVRGLIINRFGGNAIVLSGTATGNLITGNYLGVNPAGNTALGNGRRGVFIDSGATDNIIGGTTPDTRNIISGNLDGVHIEGAITTDNLVQGNYIGTDASGLAALPNLDRGVQIVTSAHDNMIGGTTAGAGNLISGNGSYGIEIANIGTTANVVLGNLIGVKVNGIEPLPNKNSGILIRSDASGNTIGGADHDPGICNRACNVISGNGGRGIFIADSNTTDNIVQGNYIGTDVTGASEIPNAVAGVEVNAPNNIIGGAAAGAGNLISGNNSTGVRLAGANATGNLVAGNYIGTDASGRFALPNTDNGIAISAANNIIGGTSPGARNLISGNAHYGLDILGLGTSGNAILGNYIGTKATGTEALPNNTAGVLIRSQASGNIIGGTTPEARNLISGNGTGVIINNSNTTGNLVQGNYIGTDMSGMNRLPNTNNGVEIEAQATVNVIGGATPGAGNLISGNTLNGVRIRNVGTDNNRIEGNFIGTNASGLGALPNGNNGVSIFAGASNNTVGGIVAGEGNIIAFNNGNGISMTGDTSLGNIIRGNSLFNNGGLGIDLNADGPTANDLLDPDTDANGLQNIPVISQAIPSANDIFIQGQINSVAFSNFTIDFYTDVTCDPSSLGEGQTYIDTTSVETDSFGNGPFSITLPTTTLPTEQFITATATDSEGNTSEFSHCAVVSPDNTSWMDALNVTNSFVDGTATKSQYLSKEGEVRWYKFEVDPGDRLVVTLTNLPANYDLTVYKDVGAAYNAFTDPDTTTDLALLSSEFADAAFSPDRFTPDRFTPDRFTPDAYSADAFSPDRFTSDVFSPDRFTSDVFSPDRFTQDAFAPDRFTPDRFTPDRFTPDRFTPDRFTPDRFTPDRFTPDPEAFRNAQLRTLVAVSAFNGTASEGIAVNTWTNDGFYYVRVVGRNGAFNTSQPFTVTVQRTLGQCGSIDPTTLRATNLTPLSGNFETLILADFDRMNLTPTERTALRNKLDQLANDVNGVVVDVGTDNRVVDANQLADNNLPCAYAKNLVAESIKSVITPYRASTNQNLKYLVLIGNDGVIPFFRQADQSLLAPELLYKPPVRDASASQASLRNSLVLTQDAYGAQFSISYDSQSLPIPDLAVGRLVETPAEIMGMIDAYRETSGVSLIPGSSLVTGYDFLADAAEAVKTELDLGTNATGDKLIARADLSPYETSLTNPDPDALPEDLPWNATQLSNTLLGTHHDIIFLAGHFSANSALAADYDTRILTQDLVDSSVNLKNTIVFSAGCHSGYNLVNGDGVILNGVSNELDWAQAFAQKQATLIAGSGYQYGDTDFIEYSERLYLEFAKQLRTGNDPVTIGEALVKAKQQYLAGTPQMRGIHAKAYLETTLFGLPMLKVDMPGARINISDESVVTSTKPFIIHPGDAGDQLGLQIAVDLTDSVDILVDTQPTKNTKSMTNAQDYSKTVATYYSSEDGVLTNPSEPILPLKVVNVSAPDNPSDLSNLVLRGVGFRGGTFTDDPNILPLTGAPATEFRGVHALFTSNTFYPVRPWSVNYYDAIANNNGSTFLYITPAQYKSNTPDSDIGTWRVFKNMTFRLFYSDNVKPEGADEGEGESAGAPPPAILHVLATSSGNIINFKVTAVADPVAGVQSVWVTYMDLTKPEDGWQSLDLDQDSNESTVWSKSLETTGPANIRYMVQAVSGTGLVTLSTNMGEYYQVDIDPGASTSQPPSNTPPPSLTLINPPTDGMYSGTAIVTAKLLTSNGNSIEGEMINLSLGYQTVQIRSDGDGLVSHTFPLNITPGEYTIRATFGGSVNYSPTDDATALFTLHKQPTSLTLTPVISGNNASFIGKLVKLLGTESDPISQQTVVFVLKRTDGYTTVLSAFTKPWGDAVPDLTNLPAGHYEVTAYFGQYVSGTAINLENELYGPSSATGAFDLGLVFLPGIPPSDSFNQSNSELSTQWQYKNPGSYRVVNNQLTSLSGGPLYWKAASYGTNQGVYVAFAKVDTNSSQQALLLKVQGGNQPDWQLGAISIVYDAKQHVIRVETYQPNKSQKWTTYANMPLALHDGDQLGAMALANGEIRIFVNGNQIATTTLTTADQTFFNSRGGYIGLWFKAANAAALDDFGGGTIVP